MEFGKCFGPSIDSQRSLEAFETSIVHFSLLDPWIWAKNSTDVRADSEFEKTYENKDDLLGKNYSLI